MSEPQKGWPARHPAMALIAVNGAIFLVIALIAEIALRIFIPYNPGFYVSVDATSSEVHYPYGVIKMNSEGFPDDEFDLSKDLRVGYFGDSVVYGVGAGYPYRFSELLAEAFPDYEHMNFAGIGLAVDDVVIKRCRRLGRDYELDVALYFFNLNDIVPVTPAAVAPRESSVDVSGVKSIVKEYFDWMRGRSFLYTYVRTAAKNFLETQGIGFHGYTAYELYPERERGMLEHTANRIGLLHAAMAEVGTELIVIMLPYEMQISQEAEEKYAELGIDWEDGFIGGSAQRIMREALAPKIGVIDLLPAFVDPEDPQAAREKNGLGEYFVYNKGDKLDWNHPNRAGHRVIAEYLARIDLLDRSASR